MLTWANLESAWAAVGPTWATIFLEEPRRPVAPKATPGITITLDGTGDLGPVQPGWNVTEFATPHTIGDQTAGTGDVTFATGRGENSLVVINNGSQFSHSDPAGDLGNIDGTIRTVSEQGVNIAVTQSTPLERFNADRLIPPLGLGSGWSALDLALQLTGFVYLIPNPNEE
jgi:hypothetical protein